MGAEQEPTDLIMYVWVFGFSCGISFFYTLNQISCTSEDRVEYGLNIYNPNRGLVFVSR